ncbi:MAG: porin family protein [Bacteroidota bacterium]|nr:porin family protein [Bacteroidota bacterium]
MRSFVSILFIIIGFVTYAQIPDQDELYTPKEQKNDSLNEFEFTKTKKNTDTLIKSNDLFYREDQFYFGLTYNLFSNPTVISQNAFSIGITMGFLRDIPINKARTKAIAIGAGYLFRNYRTNLSISEQDQVYTYGVATDFDKSKLSLHFIEIPIELRWRTSTPKNTRFWRIHLGAKIGFKTYSRYKLTGDFPTVTIHNDPNITKFNYSSYLVIGNGTLNFYANYNFKPIFEDVYIDNQKIDIKSINIGFMFYIL